MKRSNIFLTSALAAILLSGCAGKSANNSNADSDSISADTANVIAAEETLALLVTPDLTFAEAKGNVKTVKTDARVLQFDKEGKLVSGLENLKRDKDGLISNWGYDEYTLTWSDGVPQSLKTRESDGGIITDKYSYNDEGRLVKTISHASLPGDEEWDSTNTYEYSDDSFDAQGNWIKRKVVCSGVEPYYETRTITYYTE